MALLRLFSFFEQAGKIFLLELVPISLTNDLQPSCVRKAHELAQLIDILYVLCSIVVLLCSLMGCFILLK